MTLGAVDDKELDHALDWPYGRQRRIENKLARKHLQDGISHLSVELLARATPQQARIFAFLASRLQATPTHRTKIDPQQPTSVTGVP